MSKLSLTTPVQTVVSVLAGAVLTFVGLQLHDAFNAFPPVVPWTLPALLVVLGIAGFVYGWRIPSRLERRTLRRSEAFVAVVAGKAMVITGAALAGAHVVYVLRYLDSLQAETPLQRVLFGSGTILASLFVAGAGSFIEHRLVIKGPPDDEEGVPGEAEGVGA